MGLFLEGMEVYLKLFLEKRSKPERESDLRTQCSFSHISNELFPEFDEVKPQFGFCKCSGF